MLNEILVTGVILGSMLLIVTSLLRSSEAPLEGYPRGSRNDTDSVLWFGEVCRSILNTNSLRFVAANAPAEVVTSFGTQQQRLARFSLQAASAVLVEHLAQDIGSWRDFSRSLQSLVSELRYAFLLAVCTIGRAGLGILRGLSSGFPQRVQISVAAKILTKVGNLLIDTNGDHKPIVRDLGDERVLRRSALAANAGQEAPESKGYKVLEAQNGLQALDIAEHHPGAIDVLVTDVIMPQSRGLDLAKRTAELHPDVCVIFMSGYSEDALLEKRLLWQKNMTLIQKPFDPDDLARKIRESLSDRKSKA